MPSIILSASNSLRRGFRPIALLLAALLAIGGIGVSVPTKAYAVGVGTISKTLDPVQGGGFSGTNTFATGSLVRYDLSVSCSSNTSDCGIGTIIDQLDPNLEYVGIVAPTQSTSPAIPVVPSLSGQTLTIKVDRPPSRGLTATSSISPSSCVCARQRPVRSTTRRR